MKRFKDEELIRIDKGGGTRKRPLGGF